VDESKAGGIKGTVAFEGAAPANAAIKMNADPKCMEANKTPQTQETYMVTDGKLANVFVYVKDGLGNYVFDTPTEPVKIDQQACRYHPRVRRPRRTADRDRQHDDASQHHALPKGNAEFNVVSRSRPEDPHTFTQKEVMVPFKCDARLDERHVGVLIIRISVSKPDGTSDP
jgi:hypothetical protein